MNKDTKIEDRIKNEISKLENKEFTFYFFVIDTKGNPSGTLSYIYETANSLKEFGYKVGMLHNEPEFVGVEGWMGEKYSSLPHFNIEKDGVRLSASDFLIIPEIYSNVMDKTREVPCKRIVLLQNFDYLTEFIPFGATWGNFGINDCITISEAHNKRIKEYFPFVNTKIVRPYISSVFDDDKKEPKKLIVNVVTKDPSDVNRIVKPFFWKYPLYQWVSIRQLRGLDKEAFAEALKESAITIWIDEKTSFGTSALEAMKCGSLVIGKVPELIPDWLRDGENIANSGIWFDNISDLPTILASVIRSWTMDAIPSELIENGKKSAEKYTIGQHMEDVKKCYIDGFVKDRKNEFEKTLNKIISNESKK